MKTKTFKIFFFALLIGFIACEKKSPLEVVVAPIPSITITSPNGGENWQAGSSYNITWTSINIDGKVKIEYSSNNGSNWAEVITNLTDDGTYTWVIPNVASNNCLVRVSDTDGSPSDQSDAVFTILPMPTQISRSPSALTNFCTQPINAPSQSFEVWNAGSGTLSYTISDDMSWLFCSPTSGASTGEHDVITVNYITSGLSARTYNGTITISAPGASNNPQTIAVTLIVTTLPDLQCNPASLSISTTTVQAGNNFGFSGVIVNNSTASTESSFQVNVFLCPNPNELTFYNATYVGEFYVDVLGPGSNYSFNKTVNVPLSVTPGTYYVWVSLDAKTSVTESNELNNETPCSTPLVVTP